jgi:hypothetical protein
MMNGEAGVNRIWTSKKSNVIPFKRRPPMAKQDFTVNNHGRVVIIRPNTRAGIDWANKYIGEGNGWQPLWPAMLFEQRYLSEVINGIQADGLIVR